MGERHRRRRLLPGEPGHRPAPAHGTRRGGAGRRRAESIAAAVGHRCCGRTPGYCSGSAAGRPAGRGGCTGRRGVGDRRRSRQPPRRIAGVMEPGRSPPRDRPTGPVRRVVRPGAGPSAAGRRRARPGVAALEPGASVVRQRPAGRRPRELAVSGTGSALLDDQWERPSATRWPSSSAAVTPATCGATSGWRPSWRNRRASQVTPNLPAGSSTMRSPSPPNGAPACSRGLWAATRNGARTPRRGSARRRGPRHRHRRGHHRRWSCVGGRSRPAGVGSGRAAVAPGRRRWCGALARRSPRHFRTKQPAVARS